MIECTKDERGLFIWRMVFALNRQERFDAKMYREHETSDSAASQYGCNRSNRLMFSFQGMFDFLKQSMKDLPEFRE